MADQVSFGNEEELKQAIKEVRSDSVPTDWFLFTYENPKSNKIVFLAKGSGGASELKNHLKDDIVAYGLVRKEDKIDDSVTVKFAFIMWLGESVNRMLKARVGVHKGTLQTYIGQFHVDFTISSKDEISDEIIQVKIQETSGSSSRVLTSGGVKEGVTNTGSTGAKSTGPTKGSDQVFLLMKKI